MGVGCWTRSWSKNVPMCVHRFPAMISDLASAQVHLAGREASPRVQPSSRSLWECSHLEDRMAPCRAASLLRAGTTTPVALGSSSSCNFGAAARPDDERKGSDFPFSLFSFFSFLFCIESRLESRTEDAASLGMAGENCRLCGARIQTYLLEKA